MLLVVGAASRDLDPRDARGWRLGGGVTYGSLLAARLGLHVRALMGVDPQAAAASELEVLRAAGVELELVPLARGPVFDNRETAGGRLQMVHQASDMIPAAALPGSWRDSPAVLLAPVAGELADDWAAVPAAGAFVALGWQGLVRRLVAGQQVVHLPLRPGPLLARADVGLVSAEDLSGMRGTGRATGSAHAARLADLLPRTGQQLAVTRGEMGALHVARTGPGPADFRMRRLPAIPSNGIVDPTGAGDCFLAAWCAARISAAWAEAEAQSWRYLAVAAAAGSAIVEVASLAEMPDVRALCERLFRRPSGADHPT